ncbi:MAG: SpoIIE family protein phosphatase [Verrucomicrobiaceae bacterium]|nr:SpoIIE family protein phosphatase [Verrucomicrobiaceae bacterium]
MNPGIILLLAFSTASLLILLYLLRSQSGIIKQLRHQRDAIEIEEHRMFDFLHGLGETLIKEGSTQTTILHRTIVRGAAMVVDTHGAALYLLDKTGGRLVPQYQSEACPPLIPIPTHITQQSHDAPNTLGSYVRLTSIGCEWGPFGEALSTEQPQFIEDLSAEKSFESADLECHQGVSVIVAPLIYGSKKLGILAVANSSVADRFTKNDYDVFRSVAEQSAFALGNALIHHEAAEKRRLDQELNTASEVQRILLPDKDPEVKGYRIAGLNVPAKLVSGDYFDFFEIDDQHLGVVIADVSGKGVPASLITAMCRSVVRANSIDTLSPSRVLSKANVQLFPDIREDMFISLAYIVLKADSPEMQMARAGHDPPLHYHASEQTVTTLQSPGIAIGIDAGNVFEKAIQDQKLELLPGDILLLHTDGVNEATNSHGEEFGMDRLYKALVNAAPGGATEVIESIRDAVEKFAGNVTQNDDITLVALEKC